MHNENSYIENQNNFIESILSDDKFKKLIRISNPNINNKDLNENLDMQLQLSKFTRVFNLELLRYVISEYKPKASYAEKVLDMCKSQLNKLRYEFVIEYGFNSICGMDIFRLLLDEIETDFIDASGKSIEYKIHKAALIAFQIEKDFSLREILYKKSVLKSIPVKRKQYNNLCMYERDIKNIFNNFEKSYIEFLNDIKNDKTKDEDISINDIMKKQSREEIITHNKLIKNTLTFYKFMGKKKEESISKTFFCLFNNYANKTYPYCASMNLFAGHICYFRLFNIMKILILMQEFGMEYQFEGIDIGQILSEQLNKVDNKENPVYYIDAEQAVKIFKEDYFSLTGEKLLMENFESINFIFCKYLEIEKTWLEFDLVKLKKYIKTPIDKTYFVFLSKNSRLINMFYEQCINHSNYEIKQGKIDGKIINFPF